MRGYDIETVRAHVRLMEADAACIHWDELKKGVPLACADARKTEAVVAFPGGDAGFFLVLTAGLRRFSGKVPGKQVLRHLFDSYVAYFGHFYLHTDADTLETLGAALLEDTRFERFTSWMDRWDKVHRFLIKEVRRDVEPSLQRVLLREYLLPSFGGCGHLGLVRQHPRRYGVPRTFYETLIEHFFRTLWAGDDRLILDALEGTLDAGAILISVEDKTSTFCPMIVGLVPRYHGRSAFVYHPDAVAWMIDEAMHMIRGSGVPRALELHTLRGLDTLLRDLATRHARHTLQTLGRGLPVYRVFPNHHHLNVEPATL